MLRPAILGSPDVNNPVLGSDLYESPGKPITC